MSPRQAQLALSGLSTLVMSLSLLGCVGLSRPHEPPQPPTLSDDRLARCSPRDEAGQVSARLADASKSTEAPPTELKARLSERPPSEPRLLTRRSERVNRLARGPLIEEWRPLLSALERPLSPTAEAWVAPGALADVEGLWRSADLLVSLGAPLAQVLRPLIRRDLRSTQALLWLKAAPELSPLASLSEEPIEVIKAWRKEGWAPLKEGRVGLIFEEQRLLYLSALGEGVRLVQEVVRVNNKLGVEELGEVVLPVNASLLSLYTLKPNGARRAPLVIPEKEGYSLQDLQPGDIVVARYLEPLSALRRAGGALTPPLPVYDVDRAVWRRTYHVWRQGERALSLYQHHSAELKRRGAPQLQVEERRAEGGSLISVTISRASPRPLEPASLEFNEAPQVQVSEPRAEEREWGEVLAALRTVASLGREARAELAAWAGSESGLGARVWSHIELDRPLLESPPALEVIRAKRGSRALTLWATLSALGRRCELWIARAPEVNKLTLWRPRGAPPATSALIDPSLQLSRYEHLLVACAEPGARRPTLYDPAVYLSPKGVISAALFGGEALALWPPHAEAPCQQLDGDSPRSWPLKRVKLPWPERSPERHELSLSLWLDPEGARGLLGARVLYGHAEHSLRGEEGALLYERLLRADDAQRRAWLERQWGEWLGASELSSLRFAWSEEGGLALAYDLKFSLRLPARLSLSPQRWGERFASLAQRRDSLSLPPIEQRVQVTLSGAPELKRSGVPALLLKGEGSALSWRSTASDVGGTPVEARFASQLSESVATLRWEMRGGVIAPSEYQRWARFAREVSKQERFVRLELQSQSPSASRIKR